MNNYAMIDLFLCIVFFVILFVVLGKTYNFNSIINETSENENTKIYFIIEKLKENNPETKIIDIVNEGRYIALYVDDNENINRYKSIIRESEYKYKKYNTIPIYIFNKDAYIK